MQIAQEMSKQLLPLISNSTSQIKRNLGEITQKQEEVWNTSITGLNTAINMMTDSLQGIQTKLALLEVEISTWNLKDKLKTQASMELLNKIDKL